MENDRNDKDQSGPRPEPGERTAMLQDRTVKEDECSTCQSERSEKNGALSKGIFAQCLVTGAVMLTTASCGMPIGYSAILLPQLQFTNGSMHIDEEIGSWIASIHSAATPVGSLLSGLLMDKCGRRVAVQISVLPLIAGWILIAAAGNHAVLLVGRLVAGVSVGLTAAPAQVLIGEISEPYVRGIFSSVPFASYSFGILLVYAMGMVANWRIVAGLSTVLPIIAALVFFFLPESPAWLARQGRVEEATKSLTWLRGGDALQAERETEELVTRIQNENLQPSMFTSNGSVIASPGQSYWRLFLKPQVLKPFVIINVFNFMQTLSGTYLIVFYAVDIISHIGEDIIDNFLAAVLTAGVRFLFSIVSSILLAIIGRRALALGSGLGTAVSALGLAGYLFWCDQIGSPYSIELPAVCLLVYVATNTVGFMVLPGILLGELFPAKIRGMLGGITFMIFHITLFCAAKTFPFIKRSIGIDGIFWLFGGSSLLASIFLYLILPETKGRTLSQIEDYFLEKNVLWVTRDKEWERKNLNSKNQTKSQNGA